jgi:hypothetical protein
LLQLDDADAADDAGDSGHGDKAGQQFCPETQIGEPLHNTHDVPSLYA